ncbi:nucleoside/nucleotide kinase family protein [Propionibacterium sp.]|uniref:nucleoside/nucleotide kinase family protein n=1 Tax=Propionibacterium sp. TaxID=1977903 RepID=UPI0039E744D6
MQVHTVDEALTTAKTLAAGPGRRLLGLVGEPGAGKSTLAARIAEQLPGRAVVVPMDGFHLAQAELERLGRASRKGAPDTFDAWGFLALVRRLAEPDESVVYAPQYHRELHNPVAGAIAVPQHCPLVIVEGNYLLNSGQPWQQLRALFDEVWFLDLGHSARIDRLIARHIRTGKSEQAAREWSLGPDERNAEVIRAGAELADAVVQMG